MSRRIVTSRLQATGGAEGTIDGYFDRIVKYIPADVVGLWLFATGLIAAQTASDANAGTVHWLAFFGGLILTALWTWKRTEEPGAGTALLQIAVSTAAFAVWVFAMGGPFAGLDWYQHYYGSLLLAFFTVASGLVIPPE